MRIVISLAFLVFVCACTTQLARGYNVRLLQPNEVAKYDCVRVRIVSGFDTFGFNTGAEAENALNELLNKAGAAGANAVQVLSSGTTFQGSNVTGEALRCDFG
jgi:hypothetical protein